MDDSSLPCRLFSGRKCRRDQRQGTAAVEFAVILPLMVTLIFGSIEACNLVFLRQAVTAAAYEGSLVCLKPRSMGSEVVQRINDILAARDITGATISIDGAFGTFADLKHGDRFEIRVEIPITPNIPGPHIFASGNLSAAVAADKQ